MRPEVDDALQRLVDDTREILSAELCIVHLMLDDSLYFRAWSGELPEEFVRTREISAHKSVCPFVIASERPLVVKDFAADARFRDHPVHTEASLRFYAGTPLETSQGEIIGTICVFGIRPRDFEERDLATLSAFARAVMARLELLAALEGEQNARREEDRGSLEMRRILDNSLDAIATVSFEGEILDINPACTEVFGWEPGEVIGGKLHDFVLPEDRMEAVTVARELKRGRSAELVRSRLIGRDGAVRWVEWNACPVPDREVYHCFARNVTDRVLAEERMRETEVRYRALIEHNPAVTYVQSIDSEGLSAATTYVSPRIRETLGYTPQEWTSSSGFWKDKLHPDDLERVLAEDERTDETGESFKVEYRFIAKDGSVVWVRDEASLVKDESGRPDYWLGVQYDITDRKRTEEELRRTEETYRSIFENASEGVFQISLEGRFATVNPAMASIFGYASPEQMIGEVTDIRSQLYADPIDREDLQEALASDGRVSNYIVRVRRRDGSLFWVSLNAHFTHSPDGAMTGFEGMVEDITERLRLEEAQRESEERFRQLFEQSVDALFVHDEKGRIVHCNTGACRALGYTRPQLLSMSVTDFSINLSTSAERTLAPSRMQDTLWERALSGEPGRIAGFHRGEHRRRDGSTFPVEVGVGTIDFDGRRLIFASARDITEQRSFEKRLSHLASHDPLTDLPNRLLFMERLDGSLFAEEPLKTGGCAALLYLDLDGFKDVNDSFGHHIGDELLIQVARRLESCVRETDTVARLGGDEFAVLLTDFEDRDFAGSVVGRVREVFASPFVVQGKTIHLGCSVGVVSGEIGSMRPDEALRVSDREMYLDKSRRKGERFPTFEQD